jgi:hypothetical protein
VQRDGEPLELRQALLPTPGREDLLALTYAALAPLGSAGLNHIGFNFKSEDVHTAVEAVPRWNEKVLHCGERDAESRRSLHI